MSSSAYPLADFPSLQYNEDMSIDGTLKFSRNVAQGLAMYEHDLAEIDRDLRRIKLMFGFVVAVFIATVFHIFW